jgi:UDP-glucose 4-epimerase
MAQNKARFLLIGGSGFIGLNLAKYLAQQGHQVSIAARNAPSQISALQQVAFVSFEAYENKKVLESHYNDQTTVVYLLPVNTSPNQFNPKADFFADVTIFHALLTRFHISPPKRFVFISSGGGIYGNRQEYSPIRETDETKPVSYNGYKKLLMEKTLEFLHHSHSYEYVIVRPANPYGPGQKAFKGQGLIATAMGCCLQKRKLTLLGRDIVRDYIHIDDLTNAIASICTGQSRHQIYNIGSGSGVSNATIIDSIAHLAEESKLTLDIEWAPARPEDANYNVLNTERLLADFGWAPRVPFEHGIRATWQALIDGAQS